MISFALESHDLELVLRMSAAMLVGAIVGLERQYHQRVAGTRTNALVAAGAAAFTIGGAALTTSTEAQAHVAAQIVSGIGFLGAGVIFKEGLSVHGLNTAATIWCSAAIGTLFGMGQYFLGLVTGAIVLITNVALRPLAVRLHPMQPPTREQGICYNIVLEFAVERQAGIRELLLEQFAASPMTVIGLESGAGATPSRARLVAMVRGVGPNDDLIEQAIAKLNAAHELSAVSWTLST